MHRGKLEGHPKFRPTPTRTFEQAYPNKVVRRVEDMPTSFDARDKWGSNCSVIGKVQDQSACGSCWAFGATESFESRRCVATGEDIYFSADDTAGCCAGMKCGLSAGCGGGSPIAALEWMIHDGVLAAGEGVVSGGTYGAIGAGDSCKPYEFAPCAHHVTSSKYPACPSQEHSIA